MTDADLNLALLVGRVEAKVDILLDRTAGQDKRIGAVERKVWLVSGGLTALVAFVLPKLRAVLGL